MSSKVGRVGDVHNSEASCTLAKASSAMANTETYTQRGEALRARGNVLYREVSSAGVGGDASSKRDKLSRAQKYYEEALESCSSSEERASCCKNLGALHYLWGKVELESVPSWKPAAGGGSAASTLTACKEHLASSVRFFINAKVEGARAKKPKEWMDHADASLLGMVNWAAEQSRILDLSGAPILRGLCENFDRFTRKGSVKSAAGALANVELTESLSAQNNLSEALSSQCEQSLERASHLLEGLPSTATNNNLSQRISKLRMGLQWRNIFLGNHAVFCN